jgi:hypothetical protein
VSSHSGNALLDRRFRANPQYEFVPFERLTVNDRALFTDLEERAEHVGVLRPVQGKGSGVKTATRSLVALLRELRDPSLLPARVRADTDTETAREIACLVLDGILDVEREGGFVCGADAFELLPDRSLHAPAAENVIGHLSIAALRYANALDIYDPTALSARLYFYNRKPATPAWAHRLTTEAAVERFLAVGTNGELRPTLDRFWNRARNAEMPGWISWSSRSRAASRSSTSPTYKLYVSPEIDAVRETLGAVVRVLAGYDAPDFKVGNDLYGLLRPDKIVVYLDSMESVRAVGDALHQVLRGVRGHGVPFTAGLHEGGLISWGVDPPRAVKLLKWRETESWRLWITNRLAVFLLVGRAALGSPLQPWQFALARLRFEGVDISTWSPATSLWGGDGSPQESNGHY